MSLCPERALWDKIYDDLGIAWACSIFQVEDGGYVIIGSCAENETADVMILKTDADGNMEWNETFGDASASEGAFCSIRTADGNYVVACTSTSHSQPFLVQFSPNGKKQWNITYPIYSVHPESIVCTDDAGFIIAGSVGGEEAWLAKTNSFGQMEWNVTYHMEIGKLFPHTLVVSWLVWIKLYPNQPPTSAEEIVTEWMNDEQSRR